MRTAWTIAAALLLAGCSHVFYRGPVSAHFDGTRFFNLDGEQGTGGAQHVTLLRFFEHDVLDPRHRWPRHVPVRRSVPPAQVPGDAMLVTWIGHATVLMQTQGLNILTDPVWDKRDSPVQFAGPRRVRKPGVKLDNLPKIDLILISHDHYDHMDMPTIERLWRRDHPLIVTGLGNDERLRRVGVTAVARDWGGSVPVRPGIEVRLVRAHHWSARGEHDHDRTLWAGFTVTLPGGDLYYAGDTGPGDMRWALGADPDRPVRLAILPIGAIHVNGVTTGNHINPDQAVTAFEQVRAGYGLGVHWGTFELTDEPIDLPPQWLVRATAAAHIAPGRFRTTEAGEPWSVPPLALGFDHGPDPSVATAEQR